MLAISRVAMGNVLMILQPIRRQRFGLISGTY